jgi:hypothetical protein
MYKLLIFFIACIAAYQSYDGFCSGFAGTAPGSLDFPSVPMPLKTRTVSITWGFMSGVISLVCFWH